MPKPRLTSILTLNDWQHNRTLTGEFKKLLEAPLFQHALEVLKNESPASQSFQVGTTLADRAVHQAKIEAYHTLLANIEALGVYLKVTEKPLEATFEP